MAAGDSSFGSGGGSCSDYLGGSAESGGRAQERTLIVDKICRAVHAIGNQLPSCRRRRPAEADRILFASGVV